MTVLDCKGILEWPCGRYLGPEGNWVPVPNGLYANLPFTCGHLEVEVPPGCYWVIAGYVSKNPGFIHLNYTTHVGIVEVGCDQTACVKLYNPTLRLCWNWFLVGLRMLSQRGQLHPEQVAEAEKVVERLLQQVHVLRSSGLSRRCLTTSSRPPAGSERGRAVARPLTAGSSAGSGPACTGRVATPLC